MIVFAITLFGIVSISYGQQDTTWSTWNWLIGDWVGEGSGTPGHGAGWFSLRPELNGKILIRKNHAEYPATKDKPEIIHDDMMIVYRDDSGQPDRAIYFDNEGHTINYAIANSGKTIVLTSVKRQNAPVFRLTYVSLDSETVDVKFEMSQDGKKFITYTEGTCRKKK